MSTRGKIIVLVLILEIVLASVAATLLVEEHRSRDKDYTTHVAANLKNHYVDHRAAMQKRYSTRIEGFVLSSPKIINAFITGDRPSLIQHLEKRLYILKKEDPLFVAINFVQADGTIFFHSLKPELINKNVSYIPFVRDSLEKKTPLSGLVLGLASLGYRFSYPVYDGQTYMGAVIFIVDATHTFDLIAKNFEIEWGIFVNKEEIFPEFEKNLLTMDHQTLVAASHNLLSVKDSLEANLEENPLSILKYSHAYFRELYTLPLKNYAGKTIGEIVTIEDISAHLSQFKKSIYKAAMTICGVLLITVVVLFNGIGFFLKQLQNDQLMLEENVRQRTKDLQEANQKLSQEITQHQQTQKALETLSERDVLTGLYNRRKFIKQYEIEWRAATREARQISVLMIDIDWFKSYNDKYGHLAGDEALEKVAQTIQNGLTRPRDCVARYGGEEFIGLLPETSEDAALQVAEKIRKNIEDLHYIHESSDTADVITVSIGLASSVPEKFQAKEELIELADKALYRAKVAGRNCVKAG